MADSALELTGLPHAEFKTGLAFTVGLQARLVVQSRPAAQLSRWEARISKRENPVHQYVRNHYICIFLVLLFIASACSPQTQVAKTPLQDYVFTTIELPGGLPCVCNDINSSEEIVGVYLDDPGNVRSFSLDEEGSLAYIDFPGAVGTFAMGINDLGQVVGDYMDADSNYHGFLLTDGEYHTMDFPNAVATFITDINNLEQIVGIYDDTSGIRHGFILSDDEFSTVDFPEAGTTVVNGINDSGASVVIAKATRESVESEETFITDIRTYTLSDGEFNLSVVAHNLDATGRYGYEGYGINNSGTSVGQYFEFDPEQGFSFDHPRGYVIREGNVKLLGFPGAKVTGPIGINDAGQIVGFYDDTDGTRRCFLANPVLSEP